MDDLQKYIEKRKLQDKDFAENGQDGSEGLFAGLF